MTITRQGTRLEQIIRERSNLLGLIIIPADASDDFGGLSFSFYRLSLPGLMIPSESLHLFKKETQFLCTFSKHLWLAVGTASLADPLSAASQSEKSSSFVDKKCQLRFQETALQVLTLPHCEVGNNKEQINRYRG